MYKPSVENVNEHVFEAVSAIGDKTRFEIFCKLNENGKEYSFSDLIKLGYTKGNLNAHLTRLAKAGLVENYYAKRPDRNEHSFYGPTTLSKIIFKQIMRVSEMITQATSSKKIAIAASNPFRKRV